MSTALQPISLVGLSIGGKTTLNLNTLGVGIGGPFSGTPQESGTLFLFNDSGCGLQVAGRTGRDSIMLPAGGWAPFPIYNGESFIDFQVVYVFSNAQISTLLATYYYPGETVPNITLGNSPVSLGGTVLLGQTATNIVNDGNALGTSIIESTPLASPSSTWIADNSGNLTISEDIAGVVTQLLKVLVGDGVTLGAASPGRVTRILGNLECDNGVIRDGTPVTRIDFSGSDTFIYSATSGNTIHLQVSPGTDILTVTSGGVGAPNGVNFNVGRIKDFNSGTVTTSASATVNHGLSGTPSAVWCDCTTGGSTATTSTSSYTGTQFTLLNGSGSSLTFRWIAYR